MTAAIAIDREEVIQETGRVTKVTEEGVRVALAHGDTTAARAHSCLIAPREGDTVLLATSSRGRSWVIAVLLRRESGTAIEVDGDLAIRCRGGRLALGAREGISLTSAGALDATAAALNVRAVEGNVTLSRLQFTADYVMSEVQRVKSIAKTFDGIFERLSQRVKNSFRTVEEVDQLRCGQLDYRAEGLASLRSQSAVVTAEELVKIDGAQVHLG